MNKEKEKKTKLMRVYIDDYNFLKKLAKKNLRCCVMELRYILKDYKKILKLRGIIKNDK
jgi:hypothetical protein